MILNLKTLNSFVEYHHFKMDSLLTPIKMMREGYYMASVDLKDAYYFVPIAKERQKFFKFRWRGRICIKFTCIPNGLPCTRRVFHKTVKTIICDIPKTGTFVFWPHWWYRSPRRYEHRMLHNSGPYSRIAHQSWVYNTHACSFNTGKRHKSEKCLSLSDIFFTSGNCRSDRLISIQLSWLLPMGLCITHALESAKTRVKKIFR